MARTVRNIIENGRHVIIGDVAPAPRQTRITIKRCPECDEDRDSETGRLCSSCGSSLVTIERISQEEAPNPESIDELLDLLGIGEEFRNAVLNQEQVTRNPISKDYLATLGRVKVNSRQTILYDVFLTVGNLKIMAILASFSWLPHDSELPYTILDAPLSLADPIHAETAIQTDCCKASITIAQRGVVTFAKKTLIASEAGCQALIVTQTEGFVFPFEMSDSAGELSLSAPPSMPVLMVHAEDGNLLSKMCSRRAGATRAKATISIAKRDKDCSICHEEYCLDEPIVRLPCRHLYHETCVMQWLESHTSCPVCRASLPSSEMPPSSE